MRCIFAVILIALVAAPALARAQETVHRCIGEHGEISFSGARCAGASASPSESTTVKSIGDRPGGAASTCPASPDALRDLVAAAFARRDANLLAGAMRWDGVSGGAARERMRELSDLTQQPLLGIDLDADRGDANRADIDRADIDRADEPADAYDDRGYGNRVDEDRTDPRRAYDEPGYDERDHTAAPTPDDMLIVRTGSLAGGAGEHAFRLMPSGGCYWLDW